MLGSADSDADSPAGMMHAAHVKMLFMLCLVPCMTKDSGLRCRPCMLFMLCLVTSMVTQSSYANVTTSSTPSQAKHQARSHQHCTVACSRRGCRFVSRTKQCDSRVLTVSILLHTRAAVSGPPTCLRYRMYTLFGDDFSGTST